MTRQGKDMKEATEMTWMMVFYPQNMSSFLKMSLSTANAEADFTEGNSPPPHWDEGKQENGKAFLV